MVNESYETPNSLPEASRRISKMKTMMSLGGANYETPTIFTGPKRLQDSMSYMPDQSMIESPAINTAAENSMITPNAAFERNRSGNNSVMF